MITAFHYRFETSKKYTKGRPIKIVGNKNDMYECKVCHKTLPCGSFYSKGTKNSAGTFYLKRTCADCENKQKQTREALRKKAPPQPRYCECCHKKIKNLQLDHQHEPVHFRGWLCTDCNTGMGKLGDDLPGVLQAAIYLENDKNKIIETLDKVYNEMFARTA